MNRALIIDFTKVAEIKLREFHVIFKNYYLQMKPVLFILIVFGMFSCQNEYNQPDMLVDYNFYSSLYRGGVLQHNAGINTYISFSDLSQGYLSHKWELSDGCAFIDGDIKKNDSIFTKFLLPGNISTNNSIHVLFTKGGLQTIHLYDTFSDSVNFRGTKNIPSKKVGNVWVMDTTITIHVYEKPIPIYKISQNGTDVPATQDTIIIKVNESLTFYDQTVIGEPDTRLWSVAGMNSADVTAKLTFKTPGVYTGYFMSIRTGSPSSNIPYANSKVNISSVFKVIP
jgi:hypothetical protein